MFPQGYGPIRPSDYIIVYIQDKLLHTYTNFRSENFGDIVEYDKELLFGSF